MFTIAETNGVSYYFSVSVKLPSVLNALVKEYLLVSLAFRDKTSFVSKYPLLDGGIYCRRRLAIKHCLGTSTFVLFSLQTLYLPPIGTRLVPINMLYV